MAAFHSNTTTSRLGDCRLEWRERYVRAQVVADREWSDRFLLDCRRPDDASCVDSFVACSVDNDALWCANLLVNPAWDAQGCRAAYRDGAPVGRDCAEWEAVYEDEHHLYDCHRHIFSNGKVRALPCLALSESLVVDGMRAVTLGGLLVILSVTCTW
jgi:hypothetical protein